MDFSNMEHDEDLYFKENGKWEVGWLVMVGGQNQVLLHQCDSWIVKKTSEVFSAKHLNDSQWDEIIKQENKGE